MEYTECHYTTLLSTPLFHLSTVTIVSPHRHDPERVIDLDLVRSTENAALAAWKYFGKGDKNQADAAASDAMRGMFGLIDFKGLVRIGEGRKDEAPEANPLMRRHFLRPAPPGTIPRVSRDSARLEAL